MPLLDRHDAVLIIVDAQPGFSGSGGVQATAAAGFRAVAGWLAAVATALGIPIVVVEEDAERNGPAVPAIARHLPAGW